MTQRLVEIAAAAAAAGHGGKRAVYAAACAELGISQATLMRGLAEVAVRAPRKQRSDAGDVALSFDEAKLISAMLMESLRKNNKRLLSIDQAVTVLRANDAIRAERMDPATGEIVPLSTSAIAHGLRAHKLHPDQLLAPAPAVELMSLHPNHVWQIDASLCVLYYLHARTDAERGLQVMEAAKFNKNKPRNLARIESDRVWSYEVTDHNSGALFVTYVMGAESGANISESFIEAITPREGDPFHGVPQVLMMDAGSANMGGLFMNLLRRLQVKPLPHAAGNARATGQVEKARDLIERSFESALRFKPVHSLQELKALAWKWSRHYNATKIHSRHGRTRTEQWLRITEEQLRIAPPPELCRELLTHSPERRKVDDRLRVSFKGSEYDVSQVPGVMVHEWLQVTYSPYVPNTALIVDTDADGHELLHTVPLVARNEDGFAVTANVIGEDWQRPADTVADKHRKQIELLATDSTTLEEAAQKRKAKALPFGGRIDPHKPVDDAVLPTFMPRRGTDLAPGASVASQVPDRVLTRFEAAAELARRGVAMSPERNAQIASWYPDGVPEGEIDDLVHRLTTRPQLRVVGGGGAVE